MAKHDVLETAISQMDPRPTTEALIGSLCLKCRSINMADFVVPDWDDRRFYIDAKVPDPEGARNGCPFCRLVFPEWETGYRGHLVEPLIREIGEEEKWVVGFTRKPAGWQLVFAAEEGDPASRLIKRRPPLTKYDCDAAYDLARHWIRTCTNEHSQCPKQLPTALPTRLVHVGSDDLDPSLYISSSGAQGIYVALSYCWGPGKQPMVLTRSRLKSRSYAYPLIKLPPTLRDVILICRRLGYQYVWIDALCIVQDSVDAEDWKRESANMANIYGNAALTIAAAAAKRTIDGILSTPVPPTPLTCALPYGLPDGEMGAVYVIPYPIRRSAYQEDGASKEPLELRGWTLQEKLLSPKVLRYESKQMSWNCLSTNINSNGPLLDDIVPGEVPTETRHWQRMIEDFTGRNLTHNSDKLPALSGYASYLHAKTPDTYLAGLWKRDLLAQLLWFVDSRRMIASSRAKNYRAPSWSWASMDCRVYHQRETGPGAVLVTVLETSVPTFAIDPFGQVNNRHQGYVKLRGPVLKREQGEAQYRFTKEEGGNRYVSLSDSEAEPIKTPEVEDEFPFDPTVSHTDIGIFDDDYSIGSIYPDEWESIERNAGQRGPLSVLRITTHYGLLLVPTYVEGIGDVFKRIGLLELRETQSPGFFYENSTIATVVIV